MRKPDFCHCENKGADQLCSNCTAGQCLCFLYTDNTISLFFLNPKFPVRFVSDLVGNPEDRFSRITALMSETVQHCTIHVFEL